MDAAIDRLGLPVHEREVTFLEPGGSFTRSWRLDAPRCVSVLAIATRPHARVDATLRAEAPAEIADEIALTLAAFASGDFSSDEVIEASRTLTAFHGEHCM